MSSSVEKSLFDADCLGNNSLIKLAQTSTADGPHGSRLDEMSPFLFEDFTESFSILRTGF